MIIQLPIKDSQPQWLILLQLRSCSQTLGGLMRYKQRLCAPTQAPHLHAVGDGAATALAAKHGGKVSGELGELGQRSGGLVDAHLASQLGGAPCSGGSVH